jgi:photosystem II stability/assembly factor-like uncharacterized protein
MKKILVLVVMATLASCGGGNWQKTTELTVSFPFTVAGFVNDESGMTAGMFGEIRVTKSGGKEWSRIPEFNDKYAIDALAGGTFVHVGFGGLVGMIADGETSTRLETPVSGAVTLVSFLDGRQGCAVNKGNDIKITADAGKTWRVVQKPPAMGALLAIDFFPPGGIYALDAAGDLYLTTDSGANWSRTKLAIQKYKIDFKRLSTNSAALRFSDADNGTIAVIAPSARSSVGFVLACGTSDGAKTVVAEKIPCELNAGTKVFLSPDARYLTVSDDKKITVFRRR